jgi:hypothetical protein
VQVTVDEAGLASFFGSDMKDLLDQLCNPHIEVMFEVEVY